MEEVNNSIRLMTFNILVDKRLDAPYSWEQRRNQIVSLLKYYNPDIFCLQEALEHQKQYLIECFPGYECFGVGRNDGNVEGEQVPIFHRKNMFKLKDQGVFWLSETPHIEGSIGWDAKRPRTVVWKQLQYKSSQDTFIIANTHYDHKGKIANKNSANILQKELALIESTCLKILCGDFNSSEQTDAYKEILSCGFTDSSTAKETVYCGLSFTYHRFLMDQYKTDLVRIQHEHDRVFRIIDHVFHCGKINVLRYSILADNQLGVYPSDHFPVICDISFDNYKYKGID